MGSHWRPRYRDSSWFCDCTRSRPACPLLRSYSLSGAPQADHYRISIKLEEHGAASGYLRDRIRVGDSLEVSAPRGTFTLRSDERPAVLLSAGVGVTPVLAMLHALAAAGSKREVWWLYGARNARRASVRPRVRRTVAAASSKLPLHRLQSSVRLGARRRQFRRSRTPERGRAESPWRTNGSRFLPVRSRCIFAGLDAGPFELGCPAKSAPLRNLRPRGIIDAGDQRAAATSTCSRGSTRKRTAHLVCAFRTFRRLGSALSEPARSERGVRRAGPLVLPHRRMS